MQFKLVFLCFIFLKNDLFVRTQQLSELLNTQPEEFPYQVVVGPTTFCNGILITRQDVLVPASCVYKTSKVTVYLGFLGYPYYSSHHNEPNTQILQSSNITVHKYFARISNEVFVNNIALVKLSRPVTLTKKIELGKLICKDSTQLLKEGLATISGWSISQNINKKRGNVELRNKDTCNFLFGSQFLRTQQLCVKWRTKSRLDLIGNAVSMDDKIIGYQIHTPECLVKNPTCSRNDMVLNIIPFLDWISQTLGIPITEFTSNCQKSDDKNALLNKEELYNTLKETKIKFDHDIESLSKQIENILEESKNNRANYALTLDTQLKDIKTEINNTKTRGDQNVLTLQEAISSMRTEISSGLTAQRDLTKLETKWNNTVTTIENNINSSIKALEKQVGDMQNKTKHLYEKIDEVTERETKHKSILDKNFKIITDSVKNISNAQTQLYEYGKKIKKNLNDLVNIEQKNTLKEDLRFNSMEKLLSEQRNALEKCISQEKTDVEKLWNEMRFINGRVAGYLELINEPIRDN